MAVRASDLAAELETVIAQLRATGIAELQPAINDLETVRQVMAESIPDALVSDYKTRIITQAGNVGRLATKLKNKELEKLSRQLTDIAVRLGARVGMIV